jgi:hypothetical protein
MHYAAVFFLKMIMKSKQLLSVLVAGTLLSLATGCGKQESSVAPGSDNASKNPPLATSEKQQTQSSQAGSQSAPKATQEVANSPVQASDAVTKASTPVLSNSGSNPSTAQTQANTTDQSTVKPPVSSVSGTSATPGGMVSDTLQSQQQALAQAATNQFQTMAVAATNKALAALGMTNQALANVTSQSQSIAAASTNQFQAMAAAATNKALAALGMTNQALASATNQVQALLEQAKTLTANQKYQDALGYVTQLYNTKLTPDQKQQVDALKAQIQSAMAEKAESQATSVLGGFLGGKK